MIYKATLFGFPGMNFVTSSVLIGVEILMVTRQTEVYYPSSSLNGLECQTDSSIGRVTFEVPFFTPAFIANVSQWEKLSVIYKV